MAAEIITREDLDAFKEELLQSIRKMLKEHEGHPSKKWLKSHEVKKLLDVSSGTLQNLRINGTLPFSKVGGVIYYDYRDVQKMLEENKSRGYHKPFIR